VVAVAVAGKSLSASQHNSGIVDLSVLNAIFHQPDNMMICDKGIQETVFSIHLGVMPSFLATSLHNISISEMIKLVFSLIPL